MGKLATLIVLDGWGLNENDFGNAIKRANTPNFDRYINKGAFTKISASGMDVGLPHSQMGNSEVGHLNIGAGRIVYQELSRVTKEIEEGLIKSNSAMLMAMDNAINNGTALHFMGLLSDGGVHSHIEHLKGMLLMAKDKGLKEVYLHAFMDGRDTSPTSGIGFIKDILQFMSDNNIGILASISGRYYSMDRDKRYERTELSYNMLVNGSEIVSSDPISVMENTYNQKITDEFILPTSILVGDKIVTIKDKDSIIFFNFRPDRGRQLTDAFTSDEFTGFERKYVKTFYVTLTQYDSRFKNVNVAYFPQTLENTLGEYVSNLGMNQLRIAETEKYAHVTFFFNGGVEKEYEHEDRILINSPKVATYDLKPEMSAFEVADALVKRLDEKEYDLIILNFANTDMVGHTGILEAAVKAVEAVDNCLGKVVDKILSLGGKVIITADHGNAEYMIDENTNEPFTAHTTNLVPVILLGKDSVKLRDGGRLSDLAPTLLDLMEVNVPNEMDGKSLIIK
jgi:2,3-bisphosphoglycerate-independent phosphoglycerate mutase